MFLYKTYFNGDDFYFKKKMGSKIIDEAFKFVGST
jgi:hypothetical protein